MALLLALAVLVLGSCLCFAEGFGTEVISDITSPASDEGRALDLKNEQFWRPILQASEVVEDLQRHRALYADAEAAIAGLSADNLYVRKALGEALERLRRADAAVLAQAGQQGELAAEKLSALPGEGGSSALAGGQGILALALKRLSDVHGYFSKLRGNVQDRQADVLPALRSAAASTGGVLEDSRAASKYSFEVLKYDIYQKGVAKTPEAAKRAAERIVDASAETRRRFLKLVLSAVGSVARDAEQERQQPAAVVTRSLLEDARPMGQEGDGEGLRVNV
mmetsp:Transcript_37739/g.108786  ORF Transcript_37739/g.108786 Transcript_37739/m.108786 type:complete len:280 (-) Transcript_37739:105-944(-)